MGQSRQSLPARPPIDSALHRKQLRSRGTAICREGPKAEFGGRLKFTLYDAQG